jgi:hypothetical protein
MAGVHDAFCAKVHFRRERAEPLLRTQGRHVHNKISILCIPRTRVEADEIPAHTYGGIIEAFDVGGRLPGP